MKMDIVAGSGKDEFYTPEYAVRPIIKYLEPGATVWCPFDTERSNYVKLLSEEGFDVRYSHKDENDGDFFKMVPYESEIDYIVSNPPYSIKTEVLGRLFEMGIPFAMLVGVVGLFESQRRFEMFRDNPFEIMYLNRRVSYFESYDDPKPKLNPPFSSVYLTSGVLPQSIVFEEINKAAS